MSKKTIVLLVSDIKGGLAGLTKFLYLTSGNEKVLNM